MDKEDRITESNLSSFLDETATEKISAPEENLTGFGDSEEAEEQEQKQRKKKKILLITLLSAVLLILITALILYLTSDYKKFKDLRKAYVDRVSGVEGLEVDEIVEYENMHYFTVRVCLNTDDAVTVDDFVWFEASVMYFENKEEADAAYQRNTENPMGTCLQEGKILILWMEGDPFEDLYTEVFNNVLG